MPLHDVTFERPVKATLVVRLENGDEWDATEEDLDRFGYGRKLGIYGDISDMLLEAMGVENYPEDSVGQAVRYLVECAIMYDHSPWAREDGTPWDGEDAESVDRLKAAYKHLLFVPESVEA
jgi:hypothetical protein